MAPDDALPTVVLICHESDRIDAEGLASWLAASLKLVGIVALRDEPGRLMRAARREIRRVRLVRFIDVLAFRVYYRIWLARVDAAWVAAEVARLRGELDGIQVEQIGSVAPGIIQREGER